tara:strand:+ start:1060 stop:1293 length:234 start_codon:yes stop_codon:yes gene_type:complete
MPKKGKRKKKVRRRQQPVAPPPNKQLLFATIHNKALANFARDTAHAERIKTRMEDDKSLSTQRIEDLEMKRQELLKL